MSVFDFSVIPAHFPQLLKGAGTYSSNIPRGHGLRRHTRSLDLRNSGFAEQIGPLSGSSVHRFLRGTPLLVQLLVVFYVPSGFGVEMAPLPAALLGLTLNTAAFQAEIYRGGYASIPRGHVDAARVLGINAVANRLLYFGSPGAATNDAQSRQRSDRRA